MTMISGNLVVVFFGSDFEKSGLLEYAKNCINCTIKTEERNGIQTELELV